MFRSNTIVASCCSATRSNGAYREAYLSDLSEGETVIFKAYYWSANFEYFDFEYMRIDALVSEIFTSSPRIVDIYGYCGTGMINQAVMNGRMDRVAEPLGGEKNKRRSEIYRLPAEEGELEVLNDLTGTQKLEYALEMAEAITLLHSYPGGVIVHDDVTLEQFLLDDEGNVKLNDFNRAEFMLWNDEDQEYCRYKNNPGNGWVSGSDARMNDGVGTRRAMYFPSHSLFCFLSKSGVLQRSMPTNPWTKRSTFGASETTFTLS